MFSLEQNGENLMRSLEIDLERFGTHLEIMRKSNNIIIKFQMLFEQNIASNVTRNEESKHIKF